MGSGKHENIYNFLPNLCKIPLPMTDYKTLRPVTKFIFDQPFYYEKVRPFLIGGHPFKQTLELLDSHETDVILDVGCGPGYMAEKIRFKQYFGFDSDPKYIEVAQKRQILNTQFSLEDVSNYDFGRLSPNKAILSGVLHHLNDDEAHHVLKALARNVTDWIVTDDPIFAKYHFLNNLICSLDRGEHIRTENEMARLFTQAGLKIEKRVIFYSNTHISKHIDFKLRPA